MNARRIKRLVAGIASFAMAHAPVGPCVSASFAAAPTAAETLANSLRALQDGENAAPRDHWDPKYVEDELGRNPARTFAWVRGHTYWIPYHGILRGPVGVLMDRQGDSLDRALLLATMLKDEGQTVRLAHGTIAPEPASALAGRLGNARLFRLFGGARPKPLAVSHPWSTVAGKYQLDAGAIQRTLGAEEATAKSRQDLLRSRLDDQARRLRISVGKPADDGGRGNYNAMLAAAADHWWVQAQAAGVWRDWDVDARTMGAALAAVDRTVDPANVTDDLFHRITLRVVTEQWTSGTLRESVVLEHGWRPASTIGEPVTLTFTSSPWPSAFPYPGMTLDQSLRKFAVDQHEWTPVLEIGKDHVQQSAITDSGALTMATSGGDALAVARNATRGLGAAINDTFGSPAPAAAASTAAGQHLTAAWLEYQIDGPGEAPRTIRREVFDLIGPAARAGTPARAPVVDAAATLSRGLALMMTTEILPVVSEISPQYVTHLAAQSVLANGAIMTAVVAGSTRGDFQSAQTMSQHLAAGPSPLYGLAVARFSLSQMRGLVFVDQPDILTRHQWFAPGRSRLVPRTATDIVSAGIGVDTIVPSPFQMRLAQGVFDTNAEAVMASSNPDAANAGSAYDGGRDWITLKTPTDPKRASLALSPDVRQRIDAALASGHIVVAPPAPAAVAGGQFSGWWQIDTRTGETLGLGEHGWGQSMPEFAVILEAVAIGAAKGFLFAYLTCMLGGGGMDGCLRPGLIGGAIGGVTAGMGAGGGGAAGGLAGEEGAAGSGLAGEGVAGEGGAAAGEGGSGAGSGSGGTGGGGAGAGQGGAGSGGAGGAGGGGGASGGGGTASGGPAPPAWNNPRADALYEKFKQAHLAGDEALADQYAWERAGVLDDAARANGYPANLQDQLRANGYGLPFDSTGLEDTALENTVPQAGSGATPAANSPPAGNVAPPAGNVSPLANSVPGCPAPCTPGGTANLVGLGGAMNALGK